MDERAVILLQTLEWVLNVIHEQKDLEKVRKRVEWLRNEVLYKSVEDFEWRILEQL